jgi:hypothetical protein
LLGTDVFVLTSLDRNRFASTPKIWDYNVERITDFNKSLYAKDSLFVSEKDKVLSAFVKAENLIFKPIEEIQDSYKHIKNVQSYNDGLHDWMKRFKGVATKYLQNYLSWYRELDEFLMNISAKLVLIRARSIEGFPYNPIAKDVKT